MKDAVHFLYEAQQRNIDIMTSIIAASEQHLAALKLLAERIAVLERRLDGINGNKP